MGKDTSAANLLGGNRAKLNKTNFQKERNKRDEMDVDVDVRFRVNQVPLGYRV
jgi:hypothetical protein